ncbi:hypothetical protein FOL47_002641 [Perkinsus chesapeaki]|uniref:Uncharacterized protein n=1 Tax=Perkinsus chesapeaki TaxID=330153 RepID=A0A7J6MCD5_PERCH|nr:hypothetical protein FOL47_002641 [Perkinsus chesapeaki]
MFISLIFIAGTHYIAFGQKSTPEGYYTADIGDHKNELRLDKNNLHMRLRAQYVGLMASMVYTYDEATGSINIDLDYLKTYARAFPYVDFRWSLRYNSSIKTIDLIALDGVDDYVSFKNVETRRLGNRIPAPKTTPLPTNAGPCLFEGYGSLWLQWSSFYGYLENYYGLVLSFHGLNYMSERVIPGPEDKVDPYMDITLALPSPAEYPYVGFGFKCQYHPSISALVFSASWTGDAGYHHVFQGKHCPPPL